MKEKKKSTGTIGNGHPDSKFANELGALHEYEISYKYIKKIHSNNFLTNNLLTF